jgi:uncharacterized protein YcgL (UPF0745 family)
MHCFVYKGSRKSDTYLYLSTRDGFDAVPESLLRLFGQPEFVMDLVLAPGRRLAQEDTVQVLRNLLTRGFHVQLPAPDERLMPRTRPH